LRREELIVQVANIRLDWAIPVRRTLKRRLLPLLCLSAFLATLLLNGIAPVRAQLTPSEVRGVWMTVNDSEILMNRDRMHQAVDELARSHFNTIYPVVWNSGYVMYPSPLAQAAGIQPYLPLGKQKQDTLAELVTYAHQRGLRVIPWLEFGFMTPSTSELAVLHPNWLTQRKDGTQTDEEAVGEVVWLNPFHPQVQQFFKGLVTEVMSRYPVDGVQFDDHTCLPSEFGYDPYTLGLYTKEKAAEALRRAEKAKAAQRSKIAAPALGLKIKAEPGSLKQTAGNPAQPQGPGPSDSDEPTVSDPPIMTKPTPNPDAKKIESPMAADPKVSDWVKWRASKITDYMEQVQQSVKAIRANAVFSVAPNPYDTAYLGSLQDWLLWVRRGTVDELIVQIYRTDLNSFMAQVSRPELQESKKKIATGVGVLSGLRNRQIPMAQIQAQTQFVRAQGLGVTFFYFESLWDSAPEPSPMRQAQFQALLAPAMYQTRTP
jgi:uncharacterized lipoprotein YddW (UPF0748 family)